MAETKDKRTRILDEIERLAKLETTQRSGAAASREEAEMQDREGDRLARESLDLQAQLIAEEAG